MELGEVKCSIGKGGDESLWTSFEGVVSDEKCKTGVKSRVN